MSWQTSNDVIPDLNIFSFSLPVPQASQLSDYLQLQVVNVFVMQNSLFNSNPRHSLSVISNEYARQEKAHVASSLLKKEKKKKKKHRVCHSVCLSVTHKPRHKCLSMHL